MITVFYFYLFVIVLQINVMLFVLWLTLQQLQAGAASCAHMADFVFRVPLGTAGGSVAPTWTQTNIQDLRVYFNIFKQDTLIELPSTLVFLTDNCDAARFGHLDHFVHQVLCPFGKVVPLKHANWAVPHDLLGPGHRLCVGFRALWSTVQTLQGRDLWAKLP